MTFNSTWRDIPYQGYLIRRSLVSDQYWIEKDETLIWLV